MLITNGRRIVHHKGDLQELEKQVIEVQRNVRELVNPDILFEFVAKPFPHYAVPVEQISYDQLRSSCSALGIDLQFRAIGEEEITLPGLRVKEYKHFFTQEERLKMGAEFADLDKKLLEVETRKKLAMAAFKEEIEDIQVQISNIAANLREGSQSKTKQVLVTLDYVNGTRTYTDPDTEEIV